MLEGVFETGHVGFDESEYMSMPVSGLNTVDVSVIDPMPTQDTTTVP